MISKQPNGLSAQQAKTLIYNADLRMRNRFAVTNRSRYNRKLCRVCGQPLQIVGYCSACMRGKSNPGHYARTKYSFWADLRSLSVKERIYIYIIGGTCLYAVLGITITIINTAIKWWG